MTLEEFSALMESRGVKGKLRLWDSKNKNYNVFNKLEYQFEKWRAIPISGVIVDLCDLTNKMETIGEAFDEIVASWRDDHEVLSNGLIEKILEWRWENKEKFKQEMVNDYRKTGTIS